METPTTPSSALAKNKGGRPEGSMNKLAREAREEAKRTGRLPHEILLDIARGDLIQHKRIDHNTGEIMQFPIVPTLEQRIDAAKAAAPYFAPKISTVEVISGVADHELDRLIALAASEAGFSITVSGEVSSDEGGDGEADSTGNRVRRRAVLTTT